MRNWIASIGTFVLFGLVAIGCSRSTSDTASNGMKNLPDAGQQNPTKALKPIAARDTNRQRDRSRLSAPPTPQGDNVSPQAGDSQGGKSSSRVDMSDLADIPPKLEPKLRVTRSATGPAKKRPGFANLPSRPNAALQVASARDDFSKAKRKLGRVAGGQAKSDQNLPSSIELHSASARDFRKLLDAYHGNIVFVDFWATWCGPCVSMFPQTVRIHELAHQHGVRVITVSLDKPQNRDGVLKFLRHFKATSVNLLASGSGQQPLSYDFGIPDGAIPHFRLYDRQGNKRYQWSGAGTDVAKEIRVCVVELLRER